VALDWLLPEALVVERKRELFVGSDVSESNECHDGLPSNNPLLRLAVGVSRVVDEARERSLYVDRVGVGQREGGRGAGKREEV
jgi:hypothetical protein